MREQPALWMDGMRAVAQDGHDALISEQVAWMSRPGKEGSLLPRVWRCSPGLGPFQREVGAPSMLDKLSRLFSGVTSSIGDSGGSLNKKCQNLSSVGWES